MRASSVIISLLLAPLVGCSGGETTPPTPEEGNLYAELPPRKTTVSGIVYDPEAFFFSLATFPQAPPPPEGQPPRDPPPPALFNMIPYLTRSVPPGARVSIIGNGTVADVSGPATLPNGAWQVTGVPTSATTPYLMMAEPPPEGVVMGAPMFFPSPPFVPIPNAKYYPTTTLRPIFASVPTCQMQAAQLVGEAGALGAVAQLMTQMGTPTTPADLADPARTGGVVLVWVYAPSFLLDLFLIPSGGIAIEPSRGTVYPIGWAPPGTFEGQMPMGYFAMPNGLSPLGYYAVVLPKGSSGPLSLRITDTVNDPNNHPGRGGPRPWLIPPFTSEVGPGVSFARLHAFSAMAPPPPDPNAEPVPAPDFSWMCMPMPPQ